MGAVWNTGLGGTGLPSPPSHPLHTHGVGGAGWRKFGILQGRTQAGPFLLQGSVQAMEMSWWHHHRLSTLHFPHCQAKAQVTNLGTQQAVKALFPRDVLEVPQSCSVLPRPEPSFTLFLPHDSDWSISIIQGLIPRVIHNTPNSEAAGGSSWGKEFVFIVTCRIGHPAIRSREIVSAWHDPITFLFPSMAPEPGSQQREQEFPSSTMLPGSAIPSAVWLLIVLPHKPGGSKRCQPWRNKVPWTPFSCHRTWTSSAPHRTPLQTWAVIWKQENEARHQ